MEELSIKASHHRGALDFSPHEGIMKRRTAMAITISIPSKSTGGSLDRTNGKFTPNGANSTAISGVTINWPSFSFTLNSSDGDFPAGLYTFTGHFPNPSTNPCPTGAIACGTVNWPSAEGDEDPPWQASGGPGPGDEGEDTEEESSDGEEPSADTDEADSK